MTLGDIKQKVRMIGLHHFGSKADQDPFGLEYIVVETANQIARRTDCLFGRRYLDLVADQSEYCSPDVYRIRGVFMLDTGDYKRLQLLDFSDRRVDDYRESSSGGIDSAILYGMNKIGIKPTPSAALTDGIIIEGYCQPGSVWQYDSTGAPVTLVDAHECPLPEVAHDCLVFGTLYMRALQMKDSDIVAAFKAEFEQRLGFVESFAATYGRRTV
jgi:hypothetical protein